MSEEGWLVLACLGVVAALASLCGFRLVAQNGSRGWLALVPGALAIAAWIVFIYETFSNAVGDYGGDFPRSSTYGWYRGQLLGDDLGLAVAGLGYAALAALLGLIALDARRRRNGLFAPFLAIACVAVAVPALLPSTLSREPGDELRFLPGDEAYGQSGSTAVDVCFQATVEGANSSSERELDGSELCLTLKPTVEARYLLRRGPLPTPLGAPSELATTIDDVTTALNEQRLEPGDDLDPLHLRGIEVIDTRWEQPGS
jgi:hypothetical protein